MRRESSACLGTSESDLDKSEEGQNLILGRVRVHIDLKGISNPEFMVSGLELFLNVESP